MTKAHLLGYEQIWHDLVGNEWRRRCGRHEGRIGRITTGRVSRRTPERKRLLNNGAVVVARNGSVWPASRPESDSCQHSESLNLLSV